MLVTLLKVKVQDQALLQLKDSLSTTMQRARLFMF